MMNQPSSSGSLDALISICQPKEEKNPKKKQIYSREFQAMLDGLEEEDRLEEAAQSTEKKRRLSMVQVKALEKNFEVENKLEPERKVKLAEELGLQPRQVAIWFQNRRARWKTKQLEKDYAVLKANYDSLKLNYNNLEQENEALIAKLRELKAKLKEENSESNESVKEDSPILSQPITKGHDFCDNDDFDSDGIIKEKSNAMNAQQLLMSPASSSFQFNGSSSSSDSSNHQWFQPRVILGNMYNPQLVKLEEQQCMFSAEECCNFFSVDQAPTLQWYFTGQ